MKITLAFVLTASLLVVAGCGDDSSSADLASSSDLATAADMAGGFQVVEGCAAADYVDQTASGGTVSPWDTSLGKKCIKIKAGQTVTWSPAPSSTHPLRATGGTTPSPIMNDNAATVTFPSTGVYGFQCNVHTTAMRGAIQVVP